MQDGADLKWLIKYRNHEQSNDITKGGNASDIEMEEKH